MGRKSTLDLTKRDAPLHLADEKEKGWGKRRKEEDRKATSTRKRRRQRREGGREMRKERGRSTLCNARQTTWLQKEKWH